MTSSIAFPEVLSSPSSSNSRFLTHDVFLSFHGEDTRNNFTVHLYQALVRNGIYTYKDDMELSKGEKISPALSMAIEESKISIVIFSEDYASSTWCLDELLKILECKESKQQKVLAVYYKVEPSTVRHQKESFEAAFAEHEKKFDDAKVQRWKTALNQTAGLCGFHLKINEDEYEFIQTIVQEVSTTLPNRFDLHVAEYPVGIQSHVEVINELLCIEENDVRMIGIFGIGGIGKTTIVKAMYNLIAKKFEGHCFLADVRESSKQNQGHLRQLQEKILSNILGSSLKVHDDHQGMELIRNILCRKKILLVLDDVDCLDQLKKLCGRCDWFGSGSRIIITTRDESLLTKHSVSLNYPMKEMDHDEALQLFTQHAFKSDKPVDGFADLIKDALRYASGLPLALKVVGSNLRGRDVRFWESELKKYKRIPSKKIYDILKISFDGLEDWEQNIFLDIACFFKGDERKYVTKILDNCGFFPDASIEVLKDKCLITIDQFDRLWMHDLLEDMGKEIVRQESPKEPGKRSRLWFHEDVREVLEKNKGTKKIEGILIDLPSEDRKTQLSTKAFAELKNLRIFINRNASFCGKLEYLFESDKLRVFDWFIFPLEFLPSTFHGEKLIVLKMQGSKIRDLGTRSPYKNFTSIDFSGSEYLTKISDLSSCSNLKELILNECDTLVEVHDSVGFLDKLVELRFYNCSNLKYLPRSFKLQSLELLELRGCTSLEYFPEIMGEMEYLKRLWLESTVIQELPSSITYLIGLEKLYLRWCESLVHLPMDIFQMERLEEVDVLYCPNLVNFGKEVGQNGQSMLCTQALLLLPPPKSNFSLRKLSLSRSGIVSLPPWIKGLVGLSRLDLEGCKQLKEIRQLPPNIEVVHAPKCIRLFEIHDSVGLLDKLVELRLKGCSRLKNLPRSFKLRSLKVLELEGCTSLEYFPEIECEMGHLKCVRLQSTIIQELHSSITYLTSLKELYLRGCKSLVRLPINVFQLESLWAVNITKCPNLVNFENEVGQNGQSMPCTHENEISLSMELFPLLPPESNLSRTFNFSSSLSYLTLSNSGIVRLPQCIEGLVGLCELDLEDCMQLEEILHLPPNIEDVNARRCVLLERFYHLSTKSSFGTPDLERLSRIDLSECNKVHVDVGNYAPNPLLVQERFWEKDSSMIIYPGSRIPKWFKYSKETTSYSNSCEIDILDHNASMCGHDQIVALVLSFVVRPLPERTSITIKYGQQKITNDTWLRPSMDPHDRACLQYIVGNSFDQMLSRSYREGNNMRFTFGSDSKEAIFKSAGVHLIYRNESSSNASPGALSSASSSNSSSLPSQWSYDVFLSFRGDDIHYGFISHLYSALNRKGISTCIGDKLRRGEEISPALFKTIEESKISIVLFSKNYASPIWCLDELMKILQCKESKQQKVLLVFYKVKPSTVQHQINRFKDALDKHEDRFKDNAKVQRWKAALKQAADIFGLHLTCDENTCEFIKKIVQEVSIMLPNHTCFHVANYPVGLESRIKDIDMLLQIEMVNETRMIGIFGIGGIGKTTIAKKMYNLIADQFEGSCFLGDVRGKSKRGKSGLIQLQEKILHDILRDPNVEVGHVDQGINLIQEKLCRKKILLVLDDVDDPDQLKYLSGRSNWFGLGSRIIITTRDKRLLVQLDFGNWKTYSMNTLDPKDALKLFSWHAFRRDQPDNGFVKLTKLALQYAGGLPLALIVVGSNLRGRDIRFWESELKKYKRIPTGKIYEILKISFDGLEDCEQKFFLKIARFFKGVEREYATRPDNHYFLSNAGIEVLKDKCLITIDQFDRLMMHDLLEDMGKKILRQKRKRNILYLHEDVHDVLEENTYGNRAS